MMQNDEGGANEHYLALPITSHITLLPLPLPLTNNGNVERCNMNITDNTSLDH